MLEILEFMCKNMDKMDLSRKFVFRNTKRYISMHNKDKILLLEKTLTSLTNRELYKHVLYLKVSQLGFNVSYFTDYTENAEKYACYTYIENKEVQIVYQISERHIGEHKYRASIENNKAFSGHTDEIIIILDKILKYVKNIT